VRNTGKTKGVKLSKRISDLIEEKLVNDILSGKYPPGCSLPLERELATLYGTSRPTLREAITRLVRDGFLTVKKGQATIVNEYLETGSLNVITKIAKHKGSFRRDFVVYLLQLRRALVPTLVFESIRKNPAKVVAILCEAESLENQSKAFAFFDWKLQKQLAKLAGNPVFTLLLNGFDEIYVELAEVYFESEINRQLSVKYFEDLLMAAMSKDYTKAKKIAEEMFDRAVQNFSQIDEVGQ